MNSIRSLLLIPNLKKHIEPAQIIALVDALAEHGCRVGILPEYASALSFLGGKVSEGSTDADAALVLGGDGSIIEASHRLLGTSIPIIGINYGRVGFLAEIGIGELDLLDRLFSGECAVEQRMMLDARVTGADGSVRAEFTVLNDIVLTNGPVSRLISFDVLCDGVKIASCRADGIIAATPTGSTAYSLSAGGPVLDPSLEGICLTPICPHTLSSRPVIVRSDAAIDLCRIENNGASVYLNADGRDEVKLLGGDCVTIRRSRYTTGLIRIRERGFLSVLQAKLSE